MADTNSGSSSGSSLVGLIVIVAIVGALSYMNYNNTKSEIYDNCMTNAQVSSIIAKDEVCTCLQEETMSDVSLLIYVPVLGKFMLPEEDKLTAMTLRANQLCTARTDGVIYDPD